MKRFIMEMEGKGIIVVHSAMGLELAMQHVGIYDRPVRIKISCCTEVVDHGLEKKKG